MRQVSQHADEDVGVSGVFDNHYLPVLDEQGKVRLVAVIARDITQRKQIENELRQSYQTIQALLNAPSDIAVVFDLDGRIQMANETLARVLNRPVERISRKHPMGLFSGRNSRILVKQSLRK